MKVLGFAFCLLIIGCAAKPPGGGHVVGNPLAPQGMAESCGCTGQANCQCAGHSHEESKEEDCGCSGHGKKK